MLAVIHEGKHVLASSSFKAFEMFLQNYELNQGFKKQVSGINIDVFIFTECEGFNKGDPAQLITNRTDREIRELHYCGRQPDNFAIDPSPKRDLRNSRTDKWDLTIRQ